MTFTPLTGVETQNLSTSLAATEITALEFTATPVTLDSQVFSQVSVTEITTLQFVANPVELDVQVHCKPKQEDCGDLTPVKISDLPTLNRTPGDNDLILIYDISQRSTKAITFANLRASTFF